MKLADRYVHPINGIPGINYRQWLIGKALASTPSDARSNEAVDRAIRIADLTIEELEHENDPLSRRTARPT